LASIVRDGVKRFCCALEHVAGFRDGLDDRSDCRFEIAGDPLLLLASGGGGLIRFGFLALAPFQFDPVQRVFKIFGLFPQQLNLFVALSPRLGQFAKKTFNRGDDDRAESTHNRKADNVQ